MFKRDFNQNSICASYGINCVAVSRIALARGGGKLFIINYLNTAKARKPAMGLRAFLHYPLAVQLGHNYSIY